MKGKIYYRERRKIEEGEEKPRFTVAAVFNMDLVFTAEHFKKGELEQIASETEAELVFLGVEEKSEKYKK